MGTDGVQGVEHKGSGGALGKCSKARARDYREVVALGLLESPST